MELMALTGGRCLYCDTACVNRYTTMQSHGAQRPLASCRSFVACRRGELKIVQQRVLGGRRGSCVRENCVERGVISIDGLEIGVTRCSRMSQMWLAEIHES